MTPTIGRSVHYRLSQNDCDKIMNARRSNEWMEGCVPWPGQVVPLTVTQVWPDEYKVAGLYDSAGPIEPESTVGVNGQAVLDGNHTLWITSAPQHSTRNGCWFWPPKV